LTQKLPPTFFNEEIRCNYCVSAKMKKVWAIEMELLAEFVRVCEKYALRYFADAGTLIGAVRHQGFIPWDDDIDVVMPREDYDKLFEIAEVEFKHPYFFQTSLTEEKFFRTHAQLRHSLSTGFIPYDRNKNINKGIFLDIFVLDGVADKKLQRWMHKSEIRFHETLLAYEYDRDIRVLSIPKKMVYYCVNILHKIIPYKAHFDYYNRKVLARYSRKKTEKIGNLVLGWRLHTQWKREWFEDYQMQPFEQLMLRIPKGYHEVLTTQYGDYMKLPEDVNAPNGRFHESIVFEPEEAYESYFLDTKNAVGRREHA